MTDACHRRSRLVSLLYLGVIIAFQTTKCVETADRRELDAQYVTTVQNRVTQQQHVVPDYRVEVVQRVVPDPKVVTTQTVTPEYTAVPQPHQHAVTNIITHTEGASHHTGTGAGLTQHVSTRNAAGVPVAHPGAVAAAVSHPGAVVNHPGVGIVRNPARFGSSGYCGGFNSCFNGHQCCPGIGFLGHNICWGGCNSVANQACSVQALCAPGFQCCNGRCLQGVTGNCQTNYQLLSTSFGGLHTQLQTEANKLAQLEALGPNNRDAATYAAQRAKVDQLQSQILGYRGTLAERDYVYNNFFNHMRVNQPTIYNRYGISGTGVNIMGRNCVGPDGQYVYNGFFGCLERSHPNIYSNGAFSFFRRLAPQLYTRYHTLLMTAEDDFASEGTGELALPIPAIIGIAIGGFLLLVLACCGIRFAQKKRQANKEIFAQAPSYAHGTTPDFNSSYGTNQMAQLPTHSQLNNTATGSDIYNMTDIDAKKENGDKQARQKDVVNDLVRQNTGSSNKTGTNYANGNTFYT